MQYFAQPERALIMLNDWQRPLRVGRRVGRTIYVQLNDEPGDNDLLIGMMDSVGLAQFLVNAYNRERGLTNETA